PEAGFGAIAEDGSTFLNESLVVSIGITEEDIRESNSSVLREIRRRVAEYRGGRELPRLKGKTAILVDDGLASGYTMVAAIRMVKNLTPENTVVAVPVSSGGAYDLIRSFVDDIVCLHVQEYGEFAVASYYNEFPELSDEEVLELLENARGNKR
ncbi:MAG: phosphoribosyltransferase, partial [Candidatus Hydrothermarchaeaceae archaeon]